ncbi:HTH domain-containing protein [Halolactibacillus sp. JCM 19043]|uniref:HTH domain-containing protein n=1 Tax=Halolactibacillus sp. JCM 19043 TaxID=1460638 RepID=UPI000781437A|nr:HTH domain-containing protein [Halolactibacillus sp. JCM 19043]
MVLSNREKIIQLLAQNMHTYVSGQWLSDQLGISRTAVWKQMKHLEEDGYHFKAVPNKATD